MGARSGERHSEQDFVDSCANHLTRGLAARPRHRWRSESAPPAPHRPGASRLLVLVRLRLAPQPRSLVGAQCALEKKLASRTTQRRRPTTGRASFGHECTPRDWSRASSSFVAAARAYAQIPSTRARQLPKARNAGAALECHPDKIGVRERALSPLPGVFRSLADVTKRPRLHISQNFFRNSGRIGIIPLA